MNSTIYTNLEGNSTKNILGGWYNWVKVVLDGDLIYGTKVIEAEEAGYTKVFVCFSKINEFKCSSLTKKYYHRIFPLALSKEKFLSVLAFNLESSAA